MSHSSIPLLKINEDGERHQVDRLQTLRKERNQENVDKRLKNLRKAAKTETNLMPYILEAVRVYATLGEICGILREVFGEYKEPIVY